MPPSPPEPDTLRGLRRGQILEVGRTLVAEEGLAALTIGRLERGLAFSRGVITHHFRDKAEIVDAVLDSALAEIDAATQANVRAAGAHADKLRAVIHAVVRGFLDHQEASRILVAFWGRIPADARATERNAALYRGYRGQCAGLIAEGQAAGAFTATADPDVVAATVVGDVVGVVVQAFLEPTALDVGRVCDEAADQVLARLT